MKNISEYTTTELKALAFDVIRQLSLLNDERKKIVDELVKRNAIISSAEVTLDDDKVRDQGTE